jgi:rSAM/selenodomain-associated transferase 1
MAYMKKLGIFVRTPEPGQVKTRLVPPLTDEQACDLYTALIMDLFARLAKLKKAAGTIFYTGGDPEAIRRMAPDRFDLEPQQGESLGTRLENAFSHLLEAEGSTAVMIGSDSPDIPLVYLKQAYLKLKHKDVVVGPASDGGYYLIGMKKVAKPLFEGVAWGTDNVLGDTLERAKRHSLSCAVLPLWYDVDDARSLKLLENMVLARRIGRRDRLRHTERVLERLRTR